MSAMCPAENTSAAVAHAAGFHLVATGPIIREVCALRTAHLAPLDLTTGQPSLPEGWDSVGARPTWLKVRGLGDVTRETGRV